MRWGVLFAGAVAAAGVSVCAPASAQSLQEALGGPLVGGAVRPAAAAKGPGYIGVHGQAATDDSKALEVTALDPGSPAAAAGLQVGDQIYSASVGGTFGKARYVASQAELDALLADQGADKAVALGIRRAGKTSFVRFRTTKPPENLVQAPASPAGPKVLSPQAIEQARTAYFQMCGKGAERLSRETCEGMRRDLQSAQAAQAAAKREAEVMGVYRQLCAPSAPKLSAETCASMLGEAKRTLGAPAPAAAELDPDAEPAAAPAGPAPAKRPAPRRKKK